MALPSGQAGKLGEYRIIRKIAEGAHATVKLAEHTLTGTMVALKFIEKKLIDQLGMRSRVAREIRYLRLLSHPHIIKLYEVIDTPTCVVMVMEYAEGELFYLISQHGCVGEDEARGYFQQIMYALEYSHSLNIVHRDLKPENVLLDDDFNVKLGDFGLSNEWEDGEWLETGCGTPNYAAPEIIRGELYGDGVDVWSCGAILYVLVCGQLPFEDDHLPSLFAKITKASYTIPRSLSPELVNLLKGMMNVDPTQRLTVSEVLEHPWTKKSTPRYLRRLRNQRDSDSVPQLNSLTSLLQQATIPDDPDYVKGIGKLDPSIVQELSVRIGVDPATVRTSLARKGENAVKVAYTLCADRKTRDELQVSGERDASEQSSTLDGRVLIQPLPSIPLTQPPSDAEGSDDPSTTLATAWDTDPFISDDGSDDEEDEETDFDYETNINTASNARGEIDRNESTIPSTFVIIAKPFEDSLQHHNFQHYHHHYSSTSAIASVAPHPIPVHPRGVEAAAQRHHIRRHVYKALPPDDEIHRVYGARPIDLNGNGSAEPSSHHRPGGGSSKMGQGQRNGHNHAIDYSPGNARIPKTKLKPKPPRWHYGLRSLSHPMEIVHELYCTLSRLGMEWREKRGLWASGSTLAASLASSSAHFNSAAQHEAEGDKDDYNIYTVDIRCRKRDSVVLMTLRLFKAGEPSVKTGEPQAYMVDFKCRGHYKASTSPTASSPFERDSAVPSPLMDPPLPNSTSRHWVIQNNWMNPFLFFECACELIIELAGTGE